MSEFEVEIPKEESSLVRKIQYQPERNVLAVWLDRGDGENWVYFYEEVPRFEYDQFIDADSKGKYYNKYIKGEYETFER